jgi:hypothetical protein
MTNATGSILRGIQRQIEPNKKLNIILFSSPVYEKYNYQLAKTGHNFYLWTENFNSSWQKAHLAKPSNIYHLPANQVVLDQTIDFDFIIIHNRFEQFDIARTISLALHLPIVGIHHNNPIAGLTNDRDQIIKLDRAKHAEIVRRMPHIHAYDLDTLMVNWGNPGSVICPGIEIESFQEAKPIPNRCIIPLIPNQRLVNSMVQTVSSIMPVAVIQPVWSELELINQYNQGDIFLNLSDYYIDIRLLEAIASKCIVVSRPSIILSQFFETGEEILFAESEEVLKQTLRYIVHNSSHVQTIKEKAFKKVEEHCQISTFIDNWQTLFNQILSFFFVR